LEVRLVSTNLNQLWARALVDALCSGGVRGAVVCPGSRSGPIALACAEQLGLKTWSVIDERSAAFVALGIAKESALPAAVIATSGTAGANFYPAIVEAAMAHVPLIAVTADRPHELHDWGSLQTIPQQAFYGQFARWSVDLGVPEPSRVALAHLRATAARAVATSNRSPRGPVHLNAPFREPLAPTPDPMFPFDELRASIALAHTRFVPPTPEPRPEALDALRRKLENCPRGVIVCGPRDVDGGLRGALTALGRALGYPVLAEATSQVRFGACDGEIISHYDLLLRHAPFAAAHRPNVVLRFGGPLISKVLQGWLDSSGAEIVSFPDDARFVDPAHASSTFIEGSAVAACDRLTVARNKNGREWALSFESAELRVRAALEAAFGSDGGLCEPRVCREVAAAVPASGTLFISSSMPVRDVDAFASASATGIRVLANRGANGIDGTVSTALGVAASSNKPTLLLAGDLALLHDLGGLLAATRNKISLAIVVINNNGGGIFSFLPISEFPEHFDALFSTPHDLDLSRVAQLFAARYLSPKTPEELRRALKEGIEGGLHLIEARTDRAASPERHRELYRCVSAAVGDGPWR
jgi:2-succinyl-5-enolpyruvyl-6-hydroxy-3-cyclohexene-1-carboxylate synthase